MSSERRKVEVLDIRITPAPPSMPQAACIGMDTEVFYPVVVRGERRPESELQPIRKICARCPEIAKCLDYAIEHQSEGIWGGLTEEERQAWGGLRSYFAQTKKPPTVVRNKSLLAFLQAGGDAEWMQKFLIMLAKQKKRTLKN